jgi:hypothetical protein
VLDETMLVRVRRRRREHRLRETLLAFASNGPKALFSGLWIMRLPFSAKTK